MKFFKKVFSALTIFLLLVINSNIVSADVPFFNFSINPSTTSVGFSVSYSGPSTTNVKLSISGADGYYKEESYVAIPGKAVNKTYTGLTPDTEYSLATYSIDPENSNNPSYSNNQPFRTLKINSGNNTNNQNGNNTGNPGTTTGNSPNTTTGGPGTTTGGPGTTTGGPGTTTGVKITTGIKNPLSSTFSDIPSFIKGVLKAVLIIGIPIITLAIIYSGFLFVTAQGNSEQLKKAKKAILYTLIGAALLLGSMVITEAIQKSVEDIKSTTK
jgi:hypothetical protein